MSTALNGSSDFFPDSLTSSAALARNWWAVLLRGLFAVLFGVLALALPGVTIASLVLLFALYMLADGVFALVAGMRAAAHHDRWLFLIVEGAVDLAAASFAFVAPILTVLAFVYLSGVWAILSGAALIVAAWRLHMRHGRWLMLVGGAVSALWGGLLLSMPIAGAVVLTWWLGGYALIFGGFLIALALRLRAVHQANR